MISSEKRNIQILRRSAADALGSGDGSGTWDLSCRGLCVGPVRGLSRTEDRHPHRDPKGQASEARESEYQHQPSVYHIM